MKDISLHIIDIFQNSVQAKAKNIELNIVEDSAKDFLKIEIKDDGIGMTEEMRLKVVDPFFTTRTTRKVGLGIPLLKQNAELTGGFLKISSQIGKGTTLLVEFKHSHIDRQPIGDLAGAVVLTATSYPSIRFVYNHTVDARNYHFDTNEVNEILDGISIQSPEIVLMLKEMIASNLEEINTKL